MKRFLKISVLLLVSLFVLVSGLDATLDHLNRSTTQNAFTWYDEKGEAVISYNGDLAYCKAYAKPVPIVPVGFVHPRSVD